MDPLALFRRVMAWRWTPCVAPVLGSLSMALVTLAVIPDEIGGASSSGPLALRDKKDASSSTAPGNAPDAPDTTGLNASSRRTSSDIRHRALADPVQGFFHKPQELPIEPVDPEPPPPAPEPPPPAATLPEPMPPAAEEEEPGALPPPNVPLPLMGPTDPAVTPPASPVP